MTNHEKRKQIIPWIDPAERVTVHFLDEQDLNAEVTGTTEELVALALETKVPHIKQRISVQLRLAEVSEDLGHYARDPERPLKRRRLMLVVNEKRPARHLLVRSRPLIMEAENESSSAAVADRHCSALNDRLSSPPPGPIRPNRLA